MSINLLKIFFTLTVFLAFTFPLRNNVNAHAGPPFVYINGEISITYPLFNGSALFKVPNASAPQNYLVGQNIEFKLDNNLLPIDPNLITNESLTWDFGDGTTSKALTTNHRYTKPGSYFVSIKVRDPASENDVELESLLVNVVPHKNYNLPVAKIKINGKLIQDALKEPVSVSNGQNLELDASSSQGDIKSYKWDFGDGTQLNTNSKVEHSFRFEGDYIYSLFPVLRIEDKNGLISDTLVQVSRSEDSSNQGSSTNSAKSSGNQLGIFILVGGILLIFVALLLSFSLLGRKSKYSK